MSKFEPLKHGERFTFRLRIVGLPEKVGHYRARCGPVAPGRAIRENWMYVTRICTADDEGIEWARGWYTKAARALQTVAALS